MRTAAKKGSCCCENIRATGNGVSVRAVRQSFRIHRIGLYPTLIYYQSLQRRYGETPRSAALKTLSVVILSTLFPVGFRIGAVSRAPIFHFAITGGFSFFMAVEVSTAVWAGSARFNKGKLLVLLRLADWANLDGVCWPGIATLAKMVRLDGRQVQRILKELEAEGVLLVTRRGDKHQTSVYQILTHKLGAEAKGDISCKGDISVPPRVTFSTEKGEKMSPHPLVDPSIDPSRSERKKEDELSLDSVRFVTWFLALLKETGAREPVLTASIRATWAECYEKMIRLDGRDKKEVASVCRWARNDQFWRGNFMSPMKLRDKKDGVMYFDQFLNRMNNPNHATHQHANGRNFELSSDYAGITDK